MSCIFSEIRPPKKLVGNAIHKNVTLSFCPWGRATKWPHFAPGVVQQNDLILPLGSCNKMTSFCPWGRATKWPHFAPGVVQQNDQNSNTNLSESLHYLPWNVSTGNLIRECHCWCSLPLLHFEEYQQCRVALQGAGWEADLTLEWPLTSSLPMWIYM